MGKVNVIIVDATGNKEQKVGLPDDIKCGIIMVKLVEKIKLPSVGPDGNPISYKFIHKVTGKQLLEAQTLAEAGIKDGDVLRLQPEITAGAVCGNCGYNEADGNAFCSKCGNSLAAQAPAEAAPAQPTPAAAPVTPVQPAATSYIPGYTPASFEPKKNIFDKIIDKTDFITKYVGIISVVVYLVAQLVFTFTDSYNDGLYTFALILQDIGYSGFLFSVAVYLANKSKKKD